MNTECIKCIFANEINDKSKKDCEFNIPFLIQNDYDIDIKNNYNYINDYKCSYAFSKEQRDKHVENLPENMVEFMQHANKLNYYLIINYVGVSTDQIISIFDNYISKLHTLPTKLSLICNDSIDTIKQIIEHLQNKVSKTIDWKIHNLISDQEDIDKLFDVINTNLVKTVSNIWYLHANSVDSATEDLNYINFLSKVKKPKYMAIRKNDENLDGLFISTNNLKVIKDEHGSEYLKFLQKNNTLVRKYYE